MKEKEKRIKFNRKKQTKRKKIYKRKKKKKKRVFSYKTTERERTEPTRARVYVYIDRTARDRLPLFRQERKNPTEKPLFCFLNNAFTL